MWLELGKATRLFHMLLKRVKCLSAACSQVQSVSNLMPRQSSAPNDCPGVVCLGWILREGRKNCVLRSLAWMPESLGCELQKWLPGKPPHSGFVDAPLIFFKGLDLKAQTHADSRQPHVGAGWGWRRDPLYVKCHFTQPENWLLSCYTGNGLADFFF